MLQNTDLSWWPEYHDIEVTEARDLPDASIGHNYRLSTRMLSRMMGSKVAAVLSRTVYMMHSTQRDSYYNLTPSLCVKNPGFLKESKGTFLVALRNSCLCSSGLN